MSIRTMDDVGLGALTGVDGLRTVAGLGDDADAWIGLEDHPEACPHERLVIGDQHADSHASTGESSGRRACTAKVSVVGCVVSSPS
jgi:hypothetical protein